jgi:hypothetical protein
MNENIVTYTFSVGNPTEGTPLGDNALYFKVPFGATLVYVSAAPWEDDTNATLDINDDGSTIITAMACAVKAVPGEWISTHCGGTNTPITIAAGSILDFDFNSAAAANRFDVVLHFLQGSTWG